MDVAAIVVLALIGAFFVMSGVVKAREGQDVVAASVRAYKIVGSRSSHRMAWVLPRLEIATGLALASSFAPLLSSLMTVSLLTVFSVAMASVLRRGLTTDCGCHGSLSSSEVRPALIVRNAALVGVVAAATLVRLNDSSVNPSIEVIWTASTVVLTVLVTAAAERSARTRTIARTEG